MLWQIKLSRYNFFYMLITEILKQLGECSKGYNLQSFPYGWELG